MMQSIGAGQYQFKQYEKGQELPTPLIIAYPFQGMKCVSPYDVLMSVIAHLEDTNIGADFSGEMKIAITRLKEGAMWIEKAPKPNPHIL